MWYNGCKQYKMNKKQAKILLFDIETSPNLSYVWGKWEQNVLSVKEHWYLISFCAKWLDKKQIMDYSLPDYSGYRKDRTNDKQLVKDLWELFNEADIIIAHNGDEFDIKKANALFIKHGLRPPSPYKTIDTKKVAKRYFKFDSNSLDDLGNYLGLGRKLKHTGFDLWLGCMAGDKRSWDLMVRYNKEDVALLERVYLHMLPWMTTHPNLNLFGGTLESCPNCNSDSLVRRGFGVTRTTKYQRLQCSNCGGWHTGLRVKLDGLVVR